MRVPGLASDERLISLPPRCTVGQEPSWKLYAGYLAVLFAGGLGLRWVLPMSLCLSLEQTCGQIGAAEAMRRWNLVASQRHLITFFPQVYPKKATGLRTDLLEALPRARHWQHHPGIIWRTSRVPGDVLRSGSETGGVLVSYCCCEE